MNLAGSERERKDACSHEVRRLTDTAKWQDCWLQCAATFGKNCRYSDPAAMRSLLLLFGNTKNPNHHAEPALNDAWPALIQEFENTFFAENAAFLRHNSQLPTRIKPP